MPNRCSEIKIEDKKTLKEVVIKYNDSDATLENVDKKLDGIKDERMYLVTFTLCDGVKSPYEMNGNSLKNTFDRLISRLCKSALVCGNGQCGIE